MSGSFPFCGGCGHNAAEKNSNNDMYCDACGADLRYHGFKVLLPPDDLFATEGSGEVTFTWYNTPNTQDAEVSIQYGDPEIVSPAYSPYVVETDPGNLVVLRVRTKYEGYLGPWSETKSGVAQP